MKSSLEKLMEVKEGEAELRLILETQASLEKHLRERDPLFRDESLTRSEKAMVLATLQFLVQTHRQGSGPT